MSELAGFYMILVSEILSTVLMIRLWLRHRFGFFAKLFWSAVLVIPVLGPLFYLGFSRFPSTWPGEKADTGPDMIHGRGGDNSD